MGGVFETGDLEVTGQLLGGAYPGMRVTALGEKGGIRMTRLMAGPVRLDHDTFAMSLDLQGGSLGVLAFGHVISGRVSWASGGGERHFGPGDTFLLAQPEHPYTARIEDGDFELALLPADLPSQVAGAWPGSRTRPVRFTGYEPISVPAARLWNSTYGYVRDTVLAAPDTAMHRLVAAAAARLLVAVTLSTFPNTALTDPAIEDRPDAHPATVRRAVAFIDENAHASITIADVAAASFVSTRAVQLAFRQHLDTTPLQYLRRVRLDHARLDLLAADPVSVTVTEVAYRWGFPSPSRFSSYYRQAYGISPGQTLHQG
jgi:AraC-like DNA-binding protein